MRKILFSFIFLLMLFSDGNAQKLLPVRVDYKCGYINLKGELIINPQFESAGDFVMNRYAPIKLNGRYGLIDTTGKIVLEAKFKQIEVLDEKMAMVSIDTSWELRSIKGDFKIGNKYSKIKKSSYGYYLVGSNLKWGISDSLGEIIVPVHYDTIINHVKGYFLVKNKNGTKGTGIFGVVNKHGALIAPCIYNSCVILPQVVLVKDYEGWKGIDSTGRELFSKEFDWKTLNSTYLRLGDNNRYRVFSIAQRKYVSENYYEDIKMLTNNFFMIYNKRKIGMMDKEGNVILEPIYKEIRLEEDGVIRMNLDGKWGIVSIQGKLLYRAVFDYISPFHNGAAKAAIDGRWGLLGKKGNIIHPCDGDRIVFQNDEVEVFSGEEKTFYTLDKNGNVLEKIKFNKIKTLNFASRDPVPVTTTRGFLTDTTLLADPEKYGWSQKDGKWGMKDDAGRVYIGFMIDHVEVYPEAGVSLVSVNVVDKSNSFVRYGLVDHNDRKYILRPAAIDIHPKDFEKGSVARIVLYNGPAILTRQGKIISNFEFSDNGKVKSLPLAYVGSFEQGRARILLQQRVPKFYYEEVARNLRKQIGVWGYINTDGELVIPPIFQFANSFVAGGAIVKQNNKWGVIKTDGKYVVKSQYDSISVVPENDSLFYLHHYKVKVGAIDSIGRICIEPKYSDMGSFFEGMAKAAIGKKWGVVNSKGDSITSFKFAGLKNYSEGKMPYKTLYKWGYLNREGRSVIEEQYDDAGEFHNKFAWVRIKGKLGFINEDGMQMIPTVYKKVSDFHGEIAAARKRKKYGIINKEGKWAIRPVFKSVDFSKENYVLVKKRKKFGMISKEGKWINKCKYKKQNHFSEGLSLVQTKKGLYGFVDTTGNEVIKPLFKKASDFKEGLACVKKDKFFGYINASGAFKIEPNYRRATDFTNGRAYISEEVVNGFIDNVGTLVIPMKSFNPYYFSEGRALINEIDNNYYIDRDGNRVTRLTIKHGEPVKHGMAIVQSNHGYGIIDSSGYVIVNPIYSKIETFKSDYTRVINRNFMGIANGRGDIIMETECEELYYNHYLKLFQVRKGDYIGYLSLNGKWMWTPKK